MGISDAVMDMIEGALPDNGFLSPETDRLLAIG